MPRPVRNGRVCMHAHARLYDYVCMQPHARTRAHRQAHAPEQAQGGGGPPHGTTYRNARARNPTGHHAHSTCKRESAKAQAQTFDGNHFADVIGRWARAAMRQQGCWPLRGGFSFW